MADLLQLEGVLVAAEERAYKPFPAQDGSMMPGGVTYRVQVTTAFPGTLATEVKVPSAADFGELVRSGLGSKVRMTCSLFAQPQRGGGATIVRTAIEGTVEVVQSANKPRAAAAAS